MDKDRNIKHLSRKYELFLFVRAFDLVKSNFLVTVTTMPFSPKWDYRGVTQNVKM